MRSSPILSPNNGPCDFFVVTAKYIRIGNFNVENLGTGNSSLTDRKLVLGRTSFRYPFQPLQ